MAHDIVVKLGIMLECLLHRSSVFCLLSYSFFGFLKWLSWKIALHLFLIKVQIYVTYKRDVLVCVHHSIPAMDVSSPWVFGRFLLQWNIVHICPPPPTSPPLPASLPSPLTFSPLLVSLSSNHRFTLSDISWLSLSLELHSPSFPSIRSSHHFTLSHCSLLLSSSPLQSLPLP